MALANVTTTFNLSDYLGVDYDPRRTKVYLTTNADDNRIIDNSTGEIRLGGGTVVVGADGAVTATHWAPGATAIPLSWQTTFHIDHVDPARRERKTTSIGPFTITASGLLSALVEQQDVPATYLTTVTTLLDGKVTAAQAAQTAAASSASAAAASAALADSYIVADLGTSDGQVEALIESPSSLTSAALADSIEARAVVIEEAPLSPFRYGLTEAMEGDIASAAAVAAAYQAAINALPASKGSLLVPKGDYFSTGGHLIQGKHFDVFGYGEQSSALRFVDHPGAGVIAPPMFHVLADVPANYAAGSFHGFTIGFAAGAPAANPGQGIKVEGPNAADVFAHHMWLGGSVGLEIIDAPNCKAWDSVIEGAQGSGIYAQGAILLELNGIQTFQCNGSGIELLNCQNVTITGGKQIENYKNGILATNSGGININGGLFDGNSKQYAYAAGTTTGYDNIRFVGVNEGTIADTAHVSSHYAPFARKGVDVDATSYRVDVLGGFVRSGAVHTNTFDNRSTEGQVITRERVALMPKMKLGGIFLRDNAGVLEKSTDDSTWAPV